MLTENQVKEIRKHLDASENPLFILDGDTDGLCSFLLLRRYTGKGDYIIVRDSPEVNDSLAKEINKKSPDRIFILDKPLVSQGFVDKINVPVIWIDHHQPVNVDGTRYYNPRVEDVGDERCTSFWAYEATKNKDDLWIAFMGIVADWRLDRLDDFKTAYPGMIDKDVKKAPDVLYNTKFGRIIRLTNYLLKGKTNQVVNNVNLLIGIDNLHELSDRVGERAKKLMAYSDKIEKSYNQLIEKAIKTKPDGNFYIFNYPDGKISFTGELSNELIYKMPDKFIIVAREKDDKVVMSIRGTKWYLPDIVNKAREGLGGHGGGHDHACGAGIPKENYDEFISRIKKLI